MSSSTDRSADADDAKHAAASASRRKLLKAGAAASPLAFVIATRPARATGNLCQAPSAFGSMHASGPGKEHPTCIGRTPGYWKQKQHFDAWPSPYFPVDRPPPASLVASQFHGVGFSGSQFNGRTLLDVLGEGGDAGGYVALARHIAAALLNAASGKTPVLTVAAVLQIWNDYVARGYYEPTAGVKWDAEQIVTYLKSTMPV